MDRVARTPGPVAKLGAAVVGKGLVNFGLGVHDKGAVLRHRLANGAALQEQEFGLLVCVLQFNGGVARHFNRMARHHLLPGDGERCATEKIQLATRLGTARGRQRPACTGRQLQGEYGDIGIRLRGPGIGWRRQAGVARQGARNAGDVGGVAIRIAGHVPGNIFVPEHGEVRLGHFALGRQVEPDLEQFGGVGLIRVAQGKHFAMNNALARSQPLHITVAEACRGTGRVGVVNAAFANDGHGLEATVRVRGEAGHGFTVVHAPAVFAGEVLPQVATGQRCLWPHPGVARRIGIVVMHAEQKWVYGLPGKGKGLNAEDGVLGHGVKVQVDVRFS